MKFKTAYGEKTRVPTKIVGKSMTQQNFKQECDINNILKRYKKNGIIEHVNKYQGQYADLSEPVDYHTALGIVLSAQEAFDSLPSGIRKRFENDPAQFLGFVNDPENLEEMVEMGLATTNSPAPVAEVSSPPAEPETLPEA